MPHFWLSFCDPRKPKGSQFLGVSIVEADSFRTAHLAAWKNDCNPGGEVQIEEVDDEELAIFKEIGVPLNRILNHEELMNMNIVEPSEV